MRAQRSNPASFRGGSLDCFAALATTESVGALCNHNTHRATDSFSVIALRRMRDSDSTEYGFWISSKPR
ncbi:hypothetical protein Bdiaspc4_27760 [Bradyrhizobium diazoefficiens]|nr:hypothetical protein Bdiaspc4_27760 [Bradyrhizobium diazoefficiens]